jgi:hypothetical protein
MLSLRKATKELYARLIHREATGIGFQQHSINPVQRIARDMRRQAIRDQESAVQQRKPKILYNPSDPFDYIHTMPQPALELDDTTSIISTSTFVTNMPSRRSPSVVSDVSTFIDGGTPGSSQPLPPRAHKRHTRQESVGSVSRELLETRRRTEKLRQENARKRVELEFLLEQKRQRELDVLLEQARNS